MDEKYNLMIVDDESIIADSLKEMIEIEMGIRLNVRSAYSGKSALESYEEQPFDILISDIQMPGFSGLQLSSILNEMGADVRIIFLTGFDDFNYSYEAFRQNAISYLLKTESDERIVNILKEIVISLDEQRMIHERTVRAEARLSEILPDYRRQTLISLTIGVDYMADERRIRESELAEGEMHLIVARHMGDPLSIERLTVMRLAISELFEGFLTAPTIWCECFCGDGTSDILWIARFTTKRPMRDSLFSISKKIDCALYDRYGERFFFAVADEAVPIDLLHDKYKQLHAMLALGVAPGENGAAIESKAERVSELSVEQIQRLAALRRHSELCERYARDDSIELLRVHSKPVLDYLCSPDRHASEECYVFEFSARLYAALLGYINRNHLLGMLQPKSMRLDNGEQLAALLDTITKKSAECVDLSMRSVVGYVRDFVHEHISSELGVAALADATGYSAGYLSRIFKQYEGMGLHDYVTSTRMELAKELLVQTNLRIYEIAASCGYDNSTYFIKVFKSEFGITPQEYRLRKTDSSANPPQNNSI